MTSIHGPAIALRRLRCARLGGVNLAGLNLAARSPRKWFPRLTLIPELREISGYSGLTHSTGGRSLVIPRDLGGGQQVPGPAARGFSAEPVPSIPGNVRTAARLMYAGAVLDAIGPLYYGFTTSPSTAPQLWHIGNPNTSSYAAGFVLGGVFFAAVISGVWLWMAWAVRGGRNWARVLSAVLVGAGALRLLGGLVSSPASVVTLSWALSWLAGLGAIILVFQRSASAFFASGGGPPPALTYPAAGGFHTGYGHPQQSGQPPGYPWHDQGQWTDAAVPAPGSTTPAPSGPDPTRPKSRQTGLIIGASAAAAIVIIVVGLLAATGHMGSSGSRTRPGGSTSPATAVHTLTLPMTAAGYTHMTGNVGKRLAAATRKRAEKGAGNVSGPWASAYAAAPIGFYSKPGASPIVFIGFSVGRTPQVASILCSQSPAQGLDSFFLGAAVASTKDFPAGPLGGVLRCGHANATVILCAWDDSSVLVVLAEADTNSSKLARVALAFRTVAEH